MSSRRLVCLTFALAACAARAPAVASPVVTARGPTGVARGPRPLPAGIYFRGHAADSCAGWRSEPDCPRPTAAVLLGVYPSGDSAQAALAGLPAGLSLGYPLVVHTDELGLADDKVAGVAVVLGLFVDGRAAAAWLAATPVVGARAVPLADLDVAFARLGPSGPRRAVHIDPGPPAPAFSAEELADIESSPGERQPTQVVCTVPAGSVFLVEPDELLGAYFHFAPARCGYRKVYVPWTRTFLDATVVPEPDGSYHLVQAVDASCDATAFNEWSFDAAGRHPLPGETYPARAACVSRE